MQMSKGMRILLTILCGLGCLWCLFAFMVLAIWLPLFITSNWSGAPPPEDGEINAMQFALGLVLMGAVLPTVMQFRPAWRWYIGGAIIAVIMVASFVIDRMAGDAAVAYLGLMVVIFLHGTLFYELLRAIRRMHARAA